VGLAVVLALIGGGIGIGLVVSGGSKPTSAHGSPSASAITGAPQVLSVTAKADSPIEVSLAWRGAGSVDQFTISRNGTMITSEPGTISTYLDPVLSPGKTYTYAVAATDAVGRASTAVSATVTMPAPPSLTDARLAGQFVVKATFVQENYTNFTEGQTETLTWAFKPACGSGACKVRIDLFAPKERIPTFKRKGAGYSGSGTAELGTCGSSALSTTVTIDVQVTKAKYIGGIWTATALTGTLKEYSPPTFSCQSGSSTQSLRALYQGA
jgi:hypothetical protein